jgi:hypothetical protein
MARARVIITPDSYPRIELKGIEEDKQGDFIPIVTD